MSNSEASNQSVVILIPAYNAEKMIKATIVGAQTIVPHSSIVVIDDASTDNTSQIAKVAGAEVIRLDENQGKSGAIRAGVTATPHADIYLLLDADLGGTASNSQTLLDAVVRGDCDVSVGVLPSAGKKGGFGSVVRLSRWVIHRATGFRPKAPLSGQRAIRANLLRNVQAERFGLEVAITIDSLKAGARLVELPVNMDHAHTGRSLRGFLHRAEQGNDVLRTAWPRLTTQKFRTWFTVSLVVITILAGIGISSWTRVGSTEQTGKASRVLLFSMPTLQLADLSDTSLVNVRALMNKGAVGATNVRGVGTHPSIDQAYSSISAGSKAAGDAETDLAVDQSEAGGLKGNVYLPNMADLRQKSEDRHLPTLPGELGQSLSDANKQSAVITNIDGQLPGGTLVPWRPMAVVGADTKGNVRYGSVAPSLHEPSQVSPDGLQANLDEFLRQYNALPAAASFVSVDTGDLARVFQAGANDVDTGNARRWALQRTDAFLGTLLAKTDPDTMVIVTSVAPADPAQPRLLPTVVAGPGISAQSTLTSATTHRKGLVSITDISPTVLQALGVPIPAAMVGHSFEIASGRPNLAGLSRLDARTAVRDVGYSRTVRVAIFFMIFSLLATILVRRYPRTGARNRLVQAVVLVCLALAALPLASFLLTIGPRSDSLGTPAFSLSLLVLCFIGAYLFKLVAKDPLRSLRMVCGATVAFLLIDVAFGGRAELGGLFTNSPTNGSRYIGVGNLTFAVLAACTILWCVLHVKFAPRRRDALTTIIGVSTVVVLFDGLPSLGADLGGVVALTPVLVALAFSLSKGGLTWKRLVIAGVTTVFLLGAIIGLDLATPQKSQTHLARVANHASDSGSGSLLTTVARKLQANIDGLSSIWLWMVVAVAFTALVLLEDPRIRKRGFPKNSPEFTGGIALIAVGLLGYALNDSGITLAGMVAMFGGAFLVFVTLAVGPNPTNDESAPLALSETNLVEPEEVRA